MKATVLTAPAVRYSDGKNGYLTIFVDALGVGVEFEGDVLTSDDAQFARDLFSTPSVDVRTAVNLWRDALNAGDVVFEAGCEIPYEEMHNAQLFRDFTDAVTHAHFVSDDYAQAAVYARRVL